MAYSRGKIRGITIEIGGDTTQFQKAMSNVDGVLKDTQSKLKDIDRLLKLDPKNTELLRQKQEALDKALGNTKTRLDVLNEALAKAKLNNAPEEQIDALNREIVDTEQKLKSAEKEAQNFGSVFKQQAQAVGKEFQDAGQKISDVGKDLSVKLTAPIVGLGTIGITYNAELEQARAMLTTLTGSAEEADRVISQLQADAQKSPFDTSTLIQANQYLLSAGVNAEDARDMINALGNAVSATGGGNDELNRMAQNLQQIKNVGKASSQDIKQFANAGINIYGLLADSMGKNVEEIKDMEISYEDLEKAFEKATKSGGRYEGAMEKQSKTLNGSLNQTKESVRRLLGEITKSAMPIIVKVLNYIKQVIDRFSQMNDKQKQTVLVVASVVAAIGPLLMAIGQVTIGVGGVITTVGKLHGWLVGTMMPWLTGTLVPWITGTMLPFLAANGPIILGIGALIAAGVALYKNWDVIKQKASQLYESMKTVFTNIKTAISNKIIEAKDTVSSIFSTIRNTIVDKVSGAYSYVSSTFENIKNTIANKINWARDIVSNAIERIKGMFNFSWSLPHISLPHFRIDGGSWPYGLGGMGRFPSIGIDWYAKAMKNGMILNNPTIFGMMDGKLLGGGENGSETIVGTNNLMSMIQSAVGSASPTINMTVNGGNISANELAGVVISRLKTEIIRNNNRW